MLGVVLGICKRLPGLESSGMVPTLRFMGETDLTGLNSLSVMKEAHLLRFRILSPKEKVFFLVLEGSPPAAGEID